jgi:hypothetical protein
MGIIWSNRIIEESTGREGKKSLDSPFLPSSILLQVPLNPTKISADTDPRNEAYRGQ